MLADSNESPALDLEIRGGGGEAAHDSKKNVTARFID
jgi:hypothetical protein